MISTCRHCQQHPATRSRQLCYGCFENSSIRDLYPPMTRNKSDRSRRNRRLPRVPTSAPPGSEAKIRVMQHRFMRRMQLFHPQDAWA